jgi:hypothetical protein
MKRKFTMAVPSIVLALAGGAGQAAVPAAPAVATAVQAQSSVKEEVISQPQSTTVNPMTGRSLNYEAKEHQLREVTLDARIAEQELAISKSKSEQRKLGSGGSSISDVPARVPDAVKNVAVKEPSKPQAPKLASKKVGKGSSKDTPASSPSAVQVAAQIERPRYVGMMDGGDQKIAMVSFGGRTVAVKDGTAVGNLYVMNVSASSAMINGVTTQIDRSVSTVNLPETHQPVQPGSLGAIASAAPPVRGVVVQGVNTPATQPLPPGAPLNGANTQPVRFPADLYNR